MKLSISKFGIIWYFFRQYKVQVVLVLCIMIISGLMEMLNLAVLYPIVNYGLKLQNTDFILSLFNRVIDNFSEDNHFFVSCIVLIMVTIIAVIFNFLYNLFSLKLMTKIVGDTQKMIFEKYMSADYDFFVKHQQGKLIHAGTIAPGHVSNIVLFTMRLSYDLINSLFLFSLLLMLTWQGTLLLSLIGFGYAMFIKKILERIIYKCAEIANEEDRKKSVILNEFINGVKTIKIFFSFTWWRKKYVTAVDNNLHNLFKMLMGRVFPESFLKLLYYFILAFIGIYLSHKSAQNLILLIPLFGTFAMVANRFFPSIQKIGTDFIAIGNCIPNAKIVKKLGEVKVNLIPEGTKVLKEFNEKIVFENIWFKFERMKEYLLKNINFEIKKREVTAIVGPSGSGKTTMVNLLLKLYSADQGIIRIDGANVFDYSNKSYLAKFGYVSQETFIFNDSIRENISFGMEECTEEMLREAAEIANAHEFIMEAQEGYDTLVGDAGIKLSGGQRQRIAIARAMLRKPEILVLDEATSSLDNIAEKNVQEAINRISAHTTVLVIAHRLSTIQNADKIIVLGKGIVSEQGTHSTLISKRGLYYSLYTKQEINHQEI